MKQFGEGELITANDLQVGDVFKTNTRMKKRLDANLITRENGLVVVSGGFVFEPSRPLILIQRDGLPVPYAE